MCREWESASAHHDIILRSRLNSVRWLLPGLPSLSPLRLGPSFDSHKQKMKSHCRIDSNISFSAESGSRTHTSLRPGDFKSPTSTIPSPRLLSTYTMPREEYLAKGVATLRRRGESVTSLFLLKKLATPPHAAALRPSIPKEASGGIEPPHGGFAVLSVTTSPRRLILQLFFVSEIIDALSIFLTKIQCEFYRRKIFQTSVTFQILTKLTSLPVSK